MAVRVREKPKDSGDWWIFINHRGKRKSKKIGKDKKLALKVAEKIKAKLVLNELSIEKINSKCLTFKELAELWIRQPHDWKESTWILNRYQKVRLLSCWKAHNNMKTVLIIHQYYVH